MIQKDMLKIILIFVLLSQIQCDYGSFKNSRHGSHFGNECGGLCIVTTQHPSPGFYIMEIWKDVQGYNGDYQASIYGEIRSFKKKSNGKKLKPQINRNGYFYLGLCKNGIVKFGSLHRLVAIAFIPNLENKPEVNHKDGNKLNNNIDNIEWCTASGNVAHARNMGLMKKMEGNIYGAKLNGFQVRVIRKINDLSIEELANIFQISSCTIYDIKRNRTWRRI